MSDRERLYRAQERLRREAWWRSAAVIAAGLNPVFVEWMMGYPSGWVTDLDLPRAQQLKMLGNAVQPQVAVAAIRSMKEALCPRT